MTCWMGIGGCGIREYNRQLPMLSSKSPEFAENSPIFSQLKMGQFFKLITCTDEFGLFWSWFWVIYAEFYVGNCEILDLKILNDSQFFDRFDVSKVLSVLRPKKWDSFDTNVKNFPILNAFPPNFQIGFFAHTNFLWIQFSSKLINKDETPLYAILARISYGSYGVKIVQTRITQFYLPRSTYSRGIRNSKLP
jgi:hypothetical protein